jgi:hypothetical protein
LRGFAGEAEPEVEMGDVLGTAVKGQALVTHMPSCT